MLSKKVSKSGLMAVGINHGQVGERFQEALAGLQELHFLKEKQCYMVNWALRMDGTDLQGTEEQRLKATMSALKQQLVGPAFSIRNISLFFFSHKKKLIWLMHRLSLKRKLL
uniref:Uncharacterized protein n=1 Tax=Oncorhynchus mykiss TaxID=8022 RepID=A0A8C7VBX1_ONCMY